MTNAAPQLYPELDTIDLENLANKILLEFNNQVKESINDTTTTTTTSTKCDPNNDDRTTLHCKHQNNKFRNLFLICVCFALSMPFLICFVTGFFCQQNAQMWKRNDKSKLKSWNFDSRENVERRDFIRQMMLNAWNAYETHAWGCDWLKPVTKECVGQRNAGGSITASMSTLWVMGLKAEFERARDWIQREMDFEKIDNWVKVFDTVTGQIGGLLSCFALTGDQMFVDKASVIARKLGVAYDHSKYITRYEITPNHQVRYRQEPITYLPYPYQSIIPNRNKYGGGVGTFTLSQLAQQLEYTFLASITQDDKIAERLEPIWRLVRSKLAVQGEMSGLYFSRYGVFSGSFEKSDISTLWEDGSEFYANLLKAYIQSNGAQHQLIDWYLAALGALERNGPFVLAPNASSSSSSSIYYTKEILPYRFILESEDGAPYFKKYQEFLEKKRRHHSKMHITSCYIGAMLGLSASLNLKQGQINTTDQQRWMDLAENITDGCQSMSDSTKTGLMPREWDFADEKQNQYHYELSPQLAQSNFILWRLTHNQKYRDNAWKMAQSIEQHCSVEGGGYSSINNVDQVPTGKTNYQPPHFLSATLKYLYLTFTNDSVLPLDQWVFNSAGHPLPICGANGAYPNCGFSFIKLFKQIFNYLVKLVS